MKDTKIGFEVHKTSRIIKRYMDSDAVKSRIDQMTGTHGWAIGYLYDNQDKDIFQKDFEKEFDIRRSTASAILSLMEKNELIKRESVSYDARLKKITLTKKAIDLQAQVVLSFDKFEQTIQNGISKEELEIFLSVLEKINNNLERKDIQHD